MAERTVIAGRYELVGPIGRGGMGEVWAGYDKRLDRRVAVKLLRHDRLPAGADTATLVERFTREARVTARLEHPGVPTVFDAGAYDGGLYLVMQLVPGYSLSDLVAERGPLPVAWAAAIGAQVCAVLAAAHAASLVHRDLKPHNLMVCPDGTVKVLDFGVAAVLGGTDAIRLTVTGETVGTPAYMAPEQALSGATGPQTDLYALGCVLHEMLAGVPPFQADLPLALLQKHLDELPPPLRTIRPEVPADIERLVLDLLAKDPEERPADAAQVCGRLLPHVIAARARAAAWTPSTPAEPMDPTQPYVYPLAPQPRPSAPARVPVPDLPAESAAGIDEATIAQARRQVLELVDDGRFSQAAEILQGVLRRATTAYGPVHSMVLDLRLELANILLLGGDYRRALPEYERLAVEFAQQHGADEDRVLHCRYQAASCRAALGETTEALRLLQQLLVDQRRVRGPDHPQTLELRYQIGLFLATSGKIADARRVLGELLADQQRILGADHPDVEGVRQLLAHLNQLGAS